MPVWRYVRSLCGLCAALVRSMCGVCAVYVRCLCGLCAALVRSMCGVCAVFVLFWCDFGAVFVLFWWVVGAVFHILYFLCLQINARQITSNSHTYFKYTAQIPERGKRRGTDYYANIPFPSSTSGSKSKKTTIIKSDLSVFVHLKNNKCECAYRQQKHSREISSQIQLARPIY